MILKSLNDAANSLHEARFERRADLTDVLRNNFVCLKQFMKSTTINFRNKFSFIVSNIHRNLKFIPGDYKKKVEDPNSCSIFYDLENLFEFNEKKPFPNEFDADLSRELTTLLSELIDLYTIELNGILILKPVNEVEERVIKFLRESKYFQYFSYYKDQEHLEKAIKQIEFTKQLDVTIISGRYQFLSAISQIIEHISKRMLSPRMTNYLVSDINADDLSRIRNFIVHREQDTFNRLEEIMTISDSVFFSMRQEFEDIKLSLLDALKHLKLAVKPRIIKMDTDINERITNFVTNMEQESIDSINNFYEKSGSSYKYTKIPHGVSINCKSVSNFQDAYPKLAERITCDNRNMIISSVLLGNRKIFIKLVEKVEKKLNETFREKKMEGYNAVQDDIKKLKKDNKIGILSLKNFQILVSQPNLSEFEKIIYVTKKIHKYKNRLKNVLNQLESVTDCIKGNTLYSKGIDFDAYRVLDIRLYRISSFITDNFKRASIKARLNVPQRHEEELDFYKLKFAEGTGSIMKTPEAEEIILDLCEDFNGEKHVCYHIREGTGYLFGRIDRTIIDNIKKIILFNFNARQIGRHSSQICLPLTDEIILKKFIMEDYKLQHILIPVTHEEHSTIFSEMSTACKGPFKRNRFMDEDYLTRLSAVFNDRNKMDDRIKNYLAFIETSEEFSNKKDLLLEAELYLIFIDHYIRLLDEPYHLLPKDVTRLRNFRNYLAHDRELGETAISHSHEQITLRYVLEFTRKVEYSLIPALHDMILKSRIIENYNAVIVLEEQGLSFLTKE